MMGKKNHGFSPKSLPQRRSEDIRRSKACRTSENAVNTKLAEGRLAEVQLYRRPTATTASVRPPDHLSKGTGTNRSAQVSFL